MPSMAEAPPPSIQPMNPPSTPTDAPAGEPPDALALDQAEVDLVASEAAGPAALRGSVLLGGGYAATIGLSLISAPLLIRHLGISDFGRYTTVLALVTVVNGLTDAGLMNIALREWASRTGADRARFMRSLLGIRLELSAAGVVVGVLFALVAGYDSTLVLGTLVAGVGMVFTAVANLLTASLQGDLRFGWVTVINLVRQVVAVALLVALVLAGAGLLPLLASTSVAGIAALALAAVLVHGRMPLRPRVSDTQWWPLVRDTLPYAAAIAVNTFYFRITIVVMSLIATAEERAVRHLVPRHRGPHRRPGAGYRRGVPHPLPVGPLDHDRLAYATARVVDVGDRRRRAGPRGGAERAVGGARAGGPLRRPGGPGPPDPGDRAGGDLPDDGLRLHLPRTAAPHDPAGGQRRCAAGQHRAHACARQGRRGPGRGDRRRRGRDVPGHRTAHCAAARRCEPDPGAALLIVVLAGLAGAAPLLVSHVHPLVRTIAGLLIYVAVLAVCKRIPPEIRHMFQRGPAGSAEPATTS